MSSIFVNMWPESLLVIVGCVLLLFGTAKTPAARRISPILALGSLIAIFVIEMWGTRSSEVKAVTDSILVYKFQDYIKLISAGAGILLVLLAWPTNSDATGNPALQFGHEAGEFFGLMMLSIAGIFFVASANDIILLFMGIELASIPTYIMVSISRPLPVAQEAGVKYFFLGAMAAAVMLFGFSYIYGTTGQTNLDLIGKAIQLNFPGHEWQLLGVVVLLIGLGFKIAAVPLHAYAGDVYQGAATPVTAFLAFVPKTTGFVAIIKVLFYVSQVGEVHWILPDEIAKFLWVIAVLTMFVGNVLGLLQHNVKRVLAYSSIAHSGYMLVGVTALVTATGQPEVQRAALAGVLFYLASYAIMNSGAFGILMLLPSRDTHVSTFVSLSPDQPNRLTSSGTSAETFEDLAGQGRKHPGLGIAMAICCWSLTGLPLTIGFFGKFFLIKPALQAASANSEISSRMTWLVVLLVINAAISAAYYLKIIATMFLRPEPTPFAGATQPEPESNPRPWPILAGVAISVIGTLAFGVYFPWTDKLWDRTLHADIRGPQAPTTQAVVAAR
ncbi:MAG TPA: NADH-quinone oxidoreductase subunit N [Tepidisphaeraceae bacterium]|jgi:NADH-quinone oxidoreductase subunit N